MREFSEWNFFVNRKWGNRCNDWVIVCDLFSWGISHLLYFSRWNGRIGDEKCFFFNKIRVGNWLDIENRDGAYDEVGIGLILDKILKMNFVILFVTKMYNLSDGSLSQDSNTRPMISDCTLQCFSNFFGSKSSIGVVHKWRLIFRQEEGWWCVTLTYEKKFVWKYCDKGKVEGAWKSHFYVTSFMNAPKDIPNLKNWRKFCEKSGKISHTWENLTVCRGTQFEKHCNNTLEHILTTKWLLKRY